MNRRLAVAGAGLLAGIGLLLAGAWGGWDAAQPGAVMKAAATSSPSSLQQLIDQTPAHGELVLKEQVYEGNVVISKPLTIRGLGDKTVIRGDGKGNVITLEADRVKLEHLTVEHGSMSLNSEQEYSGVKVTSDRNVLSDLTIRDTFHGVYLHYANHNQVKNVHVTGQPGGEIAGQGNGIQLIHSYDNTLQGNVIESTRDGIYFYYADRNEAKNNTIRKTRYGVHYMFAHENRFLNNRFTQNSGGAAIMVSRDIVLEGNEFSYHAGAQAFGLLVQESQDVEIRNNRFLQNGRGLTIDKSTRGRLSDNDFFNNDVAVELWGSASEQVFTENRFLHNTAAVLTVGGVGDNRFHETGRGNEWGAEHPLLDLDGNGVGDQALETRSSLGRLVQENELVYLFLHSPAIPLYEKVGKLLHPNEPAIVDEHPLMPGAAGAGAGADADGRRNSS